MAKSEVDICNMALSRIGVTMQIQSLTERSKEAASANLIYEQTRDKVLAAYPWAFAKRTKVLQLTGTPPDRWAYRYEYPNDCIAVRHIYPSLTGSVGGQSLRLWLQQNRARYELYAGDNNNLTICTDQETAVVEYTARITNPLLFDSAFTSALGWALAAELALPLAKGIDYSRNAAAAYEKEVFEALSKSLNEEKKDDPPESEFIRARF